MAECKISIIVPMYNADKYIRQCASSLFEQTYENLEFIFVDDYSTDKSIEELKKTILDYPDRAKQVKLICNPVNYGVAHTRNIGLNNVTGEYIGWVDADDWVDTNMYKDLFETLVAANGDIAYCHFCQEGGEKRIYKKSGLSKSDKNTVLSNYLLTQYNSLCDMLVKTELYTINGIKFLEGCNFCEDLNVSIKLLYYAKKIVCLDKVCYHYRENPVSICHTYSRDKNVSGFKNVIDVYEFLQTIPEFDRRLKRSIIYRIVNVKLILISHNKNDITFLQIKPETNRYVWSNPYIGIKGKFVAASVFCAFSFVMWILDNIKLV